MFKKIFLVSSLGLLLGFNTISQAQETVQEPSTAIILPTPSIYICTDEAYMKKISDHIKKVEAHNEAQLEAITNFVKECKVLLEKQATLQ